MAFSARVKERALVASARHCCVCLRYKGIKVEVHHIVPEASGGPNTFENAIVLCFDCHADAGHYNADHPRGMKFSPRELIQHRDSWYSIVAFGSVPTVPICNLHSRYIICQSYDVIRELASGSMKHVPVSEPHLVKTSVGAFVHRLLEVYGKSTTRRDEIEGERYPAISDFRKAHPLVPVRERTSDDHYPYFQTFRTPDHDELVRYVAPRDRLTHLLLEDGVGFAELACALVACKHEAGSYAMRRLGSTYPQRNGFASRL